MESPTKNPIRRVQKFEGFMVDVEVMSDEKKPPIREAWIEYFDNNGNLIGIIRPD